ncbi:MAG: tetratricopeptide repeat protein [Bacteroidota bacterium]
MSEKHKESELDIDATLMETTHKVEEFYHDNKKNILIVGGVILGAILLYVCYNKFYVEPKQKEAEVAIYPAQAWFEMDSVDLALNGKGDKLGFIAIADEFGMTKTGNLAHYYAGACYMQKGDFTNAIEQLEDFKTDNKLVGPLAEGLLGDAYSETNDYSKAVKHYTKAASMGKNKLTSPIFLKKAGLVYEEQKEWGNALDMYEKIKSEYPESTEATDIDKFIAKAKASKENS